MTDATPHPGPVRLTAQSRARFRPATGARITGGLWAERRRNNRAVSVPEGWDRLHEAGNFHNLELAAGLVEGGYVNDLPFLDSDLHKWLEAVGWTFGDPDLGGDDAARLQDLLDQSCELLEQVQEPDGYLDSNFQVRTPGSRFADLPWGHELYCAGHLIQAAVALHRTTGQPRLLDVARRVADLVVRSFGTGEGQVDGVCGHPEVETALVELYRETGEQAYLDTAGYFVDRRGYGVLGPDRFGSQYWQDHLPVREAPSVEGHSVRQLYLLAGVADLYLETGDDSLRDAAERLWTEMVATKTYLTGGIGAHHKDEAFGDPYELPNERSYCETCAAIASVQFCWRMLLVTGEAKYADLLERTLYNGFLAGLSLDGSAYIYANPLQVREGHQSTGQDGDYVRKPWFMCACCPPNVMRLLASLEHYVVVSDAEAVRIHQYVPGSYTAPVGSGEATLDVQTDYPWSGSVGVRVAATPGGQWGIGLRVPHWAATAEVRVNGEPSEAGVQDGWLTVSREWADGDELVLELPLTARFTRSDPRVDVNRGAVAVEYGPLVYCLEAVDNPGQRLDDVVVDATTAPVVGGPEEALDGVVTLTLRAGVHEHDDSVWWPYPTVSEPVDEPAPADLTAVPYFAWGNRAQGAMRVWIPAG